MADGYTEEHGGQVQPDPKNGQEQREKDIVQECVARFALVSSIEHSQRAREDEELEFVDEEQWSPGAIASRSEHVDEATGRKVPARPRMTINLTEGPIQQMMGEAREARITWSVKRRGGTVSGKATGYLKGLLRRIQNDSGANAVRLWALEQAGKVGRGAYAIDTDYANDGDFDLDIILRRILDQRTVYLDPHSQALDYSDAQWAIIKDWMSEEERQRRWPKKPIVPPEDAFTSEDDEWFGVANQGDEKSKRVAIAQYFRIEYEPREIAYHPAVGTRLLADMPDAHRVAVERGEPGTRRRTIDVPRVKKYYLDGTQILEEHDWPGRYIPIAPTVGKEYVHKGRRKWKGEVRGLMDVQRGYNVAVSAAVEAAAKVPRMSFLIAEGQDEQLEDYWDQLWTANSTRIPYKQTDIAGKDAPPPIPMSIEPAIQGVLLLGRVLKDDMGSITGRVDPALRALNPQDRSGEAIKALQTQGTLAMSGYLENLSDVTMAHEARIILDLIPKVYDRPGRVLWISDEDSNDNETPIILKTPFVRDQDGNPVPVPCQTCQGAGVVMMQPQGQGLIDKYLRAPVRQTCPACNGQGQATRENMPAQYNEQEVEYVDFSEGQYRVEVTLARAYKTKQEEGLAAMKELATSAPNLIGVFAGPWVRAMGFPGSQEIADALDALSPAGQKELPPAAAARVQELEQQLQMTTQALDETRRVVDGDQVKAASNQEIARIKAEATQLVEQLKAQARAQIEEAKLAARANEQLAAQAGAPALEELRAYLKSIEQENQQRHEVLMELLKQQGTLRLAEDARIAQAVNREQDREAAFQERGVRPEAVSNDNL